MGDGERGMHGQQSVQLCECGVPRSGVHIRCKTIYRGYYIYYTQLLVKGVEAGDKQDQRDREGSRRRRRERKWEIEEQRVKESIHCHGRCHILRSFRHDVHKVYEEGAAVSSCGAPLLSSLHQRSRQGHVYRRCGRCKQPWFPCPLSLYLTSSLSSPTSRLLSSAA